MKSAWFRQLTLVVLAAASLALNACGQAPTTATPTVQPVPTSTPSGSASTMATPTATTAAPVDRDMTAYFQGKTIILNVGYAPGGGYDLFTRAFASVAPKYFPGRPRFTVRNLPGSGSLRAIQATMAAPPDGLAAQAIHSSFFKLLAVGEDPGFDLASATIVGNPQFLSTYSLYCLRRSLGTTWDDLLGLGRAVTDGSGEPGTSSAVSGVEFIQHTGGPMRVVYGYGGTAEILAAVDRGELDGTARCSESGVSRLYPEWITGQYLVPVVWWDVPIPQSYLDALGAPATPPHIFDVASGASEQQKKAFETTISMGKVDRTFIMPPQMPEDLKTFWRDAFKSVVEDQQFVDILAAANQEVAYGSPEAIETAMLEAEALSAEGREFFKRLNGMQ